MNKGI